MVAESKDAKELNGFQALWRKIESCEQRNAKAVIKVDKLYSDYQSILLPHEKLYGASHCKLVGHLLSFVPSKDLKKNDKLSLLEYLSDHFDKMESAPHLYDSSELSKLQEENDKYYQKYFAKELKEDIEADYDELKSMLSMALGEDIDLPDEALKEAIIAGDFSKVESLLAEVKQAYIDKRSDEKDDAWDDYEFNYYRDEDDETSKVTEIFKASQLTKMYKKIANVIHPDKEQDPLKKEQRHKQMQALLLAKKEADVFTLIKMYQAFVPEGEYFLDDSAMEHIEHLLQMRIQKLNREHREIFNSQGHKSYIWKAYSLTSKKKTLEKMNQHIAEIKQHIAIMDDKVKTLDSVKKVKKMLQRSYF